MNTNYRRKLAILLLIAAALAGSGCSTLSAALDTATDPRLLTIIDTLRDLIDHYQLRLNNPLLESHHKLDTEDHFKALAAKIEVQLQELEKLGYRRRAAHWRAELGLPRDGHS